MNTMKINYRKNGNGIRTTITLSSALIDTWFVARGLDDNDWNSAIDTLRQFIEATPESKTGETFQSMVEWFLLSDIRDCIRGLKESSAHGDS